MPLDYSRKLVLAMTLPLAAAAVGVSGASAATPACKTAQLGVSQTGADGGVGHFGEFFLLTDKGHAGRTVKGYLSLRLLNAKRQPMPTAVGHGATYLHGKDPGPHLITLAPGGHARAWVEWSDVPSSGEPTTKACEPTSSFIRVTAPGATGGTVVTFRQMVCGHGGFLTSALTH
jgi:hypothetical protein